MVYYIEQHKRCKNTDTLDKIALELGIARNVETFLKFIKGKSEMTSFRGYKNQRGKNVCF